MTTSEVAHTTPSHADQPLRILLLDSPRTCSYTLRRIFQNHVQLDLSAATAVDSIHLFASASTYGPERLALKLRYSPAAKAAREKWIKAMPERAGETYASPLDKWRKNVEMIEAKVSLSQVFASRWLR